MSIRLEPTAGLRFSPTPPSESNDTILEDRTQWVPRHQGPHVFPNYFLFSRFLRWSYKRHLVAIRDITFGYTATYAQLLTDVLHLRNVLRQALPLSVVERIDR